MLNLPCIKEVVVNPLVDGWWSLNQQILLFKSFEITEVTQTSHFVYFMQKLVLANKDTLTQLRSSFDKPDVMRDLTRKLMSKGIRLFAMTN